MLKDIVIQTNWVDIFILVIFIRICYMAVANGFPVECFKLLGTLSAIYISLHYYTLFTDFIRQRAQSAEKIPLEFLDFVFFIVLVLLGYSIFVAIRILFVNLIKMEAVPKLNKAGGFILGFGRAFLFSGLIMYMLTISTIRYFKDSVVDSYFGSRFFKIGPATYSWVWNKLTSKFMTAEKFNKTIQEIQKDFSPE